MRQPKRYDVPKLKQQAILDTFKVQLGGKFEPLINDLANQSVEGCYNKFVDDINKRTKNMMWYRRNKAIDSLSQEAEDLCEKRRALRKKVLNSKRPYESTIQEYKKVNRMVKKKKKWKKQKEKN